MEKRNLVIVSLGIIIVVLAATYIVMQDRPDGDRAADTAELLENGEFQAFYDGCDPALQSAVGGVEGLATVWNQYTYGIGGYETVERTESMRSGMNEIAQVYCKHSDWGLLLTITFSPDGSIVGLFFNYYEPEGSDPLPDGLAVEDVTVDSGSGYPLPGTLTYSEGSSKDRAAVIVHGSGPNDRDGTIMANKPYRDIARGLALQGIDVLTYDKRTFVYSQICDDPRYMTVDDETVDDAVAAVRMLNDMGYDEVYIIGHSMGGMLAPYITQRCGDLCDGFVSMAGSPRTITDILADQLWAQCGQLPDADSYREYIDGELSKADALAGMTDEQRASTTVFGQNGYYIWSLNSLDEVAIAGSLSVPMLFLHGSADIQTYADKDHGAWKESLTGTDAEFILYDGLNHLFMESEGPYAGTALEYNLHGTVEQSVLDDIAEFITGA